MNNKVIIEINKDRTEIEECVIKTAQVLKKFGVTEKTATRFSLYLEEVLNYICNDEFDTEDKLTVIIRKWMDRVTIKINIRGEEITLHKSDKTKEKTSQELLSMNDDEMEESLNLMLILAGMDTISSRYRLKTNEYIINVKNSQYEMLMRVVIAMILGLVTGVAMRNLLTPELYTYITNNIFQTVTSMFMNAIKMIIGPVVFCSIVYCISSYSDLSFLQKVGKNTLIHYLIDAIVGIGVSVLVCMVFKPGITNIPTSLMKLDASTLNIDTSAGVKSIWETISGIIPSNIFGAFYSTNILQIIFIATVLGVAVGGIGEKGTIIRDNVRALDRTFSKMTEYIMYFLPAMVFCSMAGMAINIGFDTIVLILYWLSLVFLGYLIMILLYSIMVWIGTRTNPVSYFRKVISCLLVAFSVGSSSASMANTMSTCEKELKIKPKVYSFSVPLGVSVHSCSSCILYIVSVVFLNNIYNGSNTLNQMGPLFYFTVFLLALGAPSVSGSGPICVAMLLSSIGTPMELVALILAWDPNVSTIKTACSSMEDLSVAYMVDHELKKSEIRNSKQQ